MPFLAGHFDDESTPALDSGNHADRFVLPLENRPLLDMRLHEAGDIEAKRSRPDDGELCSQLLQRVADGFAALVLDVEGIGEKPGIDEIARSHQSGHEA